jgi:hypothetical protein
VVGVYAFYKLTQWLISRRAAIVGSILLSVATFHIEYSQQLREYSMSFLLTCLLLYSYLLFVENPNRLNWAFLVLSSAVSILTQYGLVIILLTLNLYAILDIGGLEKRRDFIRIWGFAQLINLLLLLVVYLTALRFQFSISGFGYLERGYWDGGLGGLLSYLYRQSYEILLFTFEDPPIFIFTLAVGIIHLGKNPSHRMFLVRLVIPFGIAMLLGILGLYPYVGSRQAIYLTPFLFLLLCAGFEYMLKVDPKRIIAFSSIILMLRVYITQSIDYLGSSGIQNMRQLVKILEAEYVPTDEIYVCAAGVPAFRYYFEGDPKTLLPQGEGEEWQTILGGALSGQSRLWIVWVGQCGNESTYTDFVQSRRDLKLRASDFQASLYLVP